MNKSKAEAIRLIKTAVSEGWERRVSNIQCAGFPKYATMVCLSRTREVGAFSRSWAQIIVNFRRPNSPGRRESVSYTVRAEYYSKNGRLARHGHRNAAYQIQRLKEEFERDARGLRPI